ncbi:MAG: S41 family peptidase [Gemmatimonadota bacterium]
MYRTTFVTSLALALTAASPAAAQDYVDVLTFEASAETGALRGWNGGPPATLHIDSMVVHGGRYAGRITRDAESESEFSVVALSLPVEFSGQTVELRGWLRTEDVAEGFAALWLRQDGPGGVLGIDNMQDRNLSGTTEWTEYTVTLTLHSSARRLVMGALLSGQGTLWVDDLELLVDGGPAAAAPRVEVEPTPAELDTEFDEGSGIADREPTPLQVENLALLSRVWGFVKYHHPRVTAGQLNWDYELFRVLPAVLEATDHASATAALAEWLARVGDPDPCSRCASPPLALHLAPETDWIGDRGLLGPELSGRLVAIHRNRSAEVGQYYVTHNPNVGNPDFANESAYADMSFPDAGFRLLGLFRWWNIIEYWFPYRDQLDADWDDVLEEYIPRMMTADDPDAYQLAMMEVIARVDDTHANLWSSLAVRPPVGSAQLPVVVRFVQGDAVVTGYAHAELGPATGLQVGDVIETLDGAPVDSLVDAWRRYYAASNGPTRLRDMGRQLTRGPQGPVTVTGRRAAGPFELVAERAPLDELDARAGFTHDLPGETVQRITDEVVYLKLSSVAAAEAADYVRQADGSKILVIDIRNYPSEFVVFALGRHLVTEPSEFARFTRGDASNPGAFVWGPAVSLTPAEPRYDGKVVVLIDEVSQSQAEYTTMAFRSAPNVTVVGSTTAGADGNVSTVPLPGGLRGMISGIGVFYPDRSPTQRTGILPDLVVEPTLAGIREGRDEVLETAVSHALGRPWRLPEGRGSGG